MRTVCVVTGTRADFGLLRFVMRGIAASPALRLQVVATGMHLSPEFGLTWREIEEEGIAIDRRVEMLLSSDTGVGIAKSLALGVAGCADALAELRPDLLLVLGDRFEIFAAAAAAMAARIPIAHLHGGEASEGAIDESIRHAITKMAHLHFVAAEEYRRRVVQLGEQPDRVFTVGGLGLDGIARLPLLGREALEASLGFRFGVRNLLVTYHPATLEERTAEAQMSELLAALDRLEETHVVFTMPNADNDGRALIRLIEDHVARHPDTTRAYASLGQLRYLSTVAQVDAVVGNSSSGLIEVPTFRKATINIGDRQRGRLRAASVIDCAPEREAIAAAIRRAYAPEFQDLLRTVENPYGRGGASEAIVRTLESVPLDGLLKKRFHDA